MSSKDEELSAFTLFKGILGLTATLAIFAGVGTLTNATGVTQISALPAAPPPQQEVSLYQGEMVGVLNCALGHGGALVNQGNLAVGLGADERNAACWSAKQYAYTLVVEQNYFGVSDPESEFRALDRLWLNESNWDPWIVNMSTYAQFIPQAIRSIHGVTSEPGDWRSQVDWGLQYIKGKYGTPSAALTWWLRTDPRPANLCPRNCYGGHWY